MVVSGSSKKPMEGRFKESIETERRTSTSSSGDGRFGPVQKYIRHLARSGEGRPVFHIAALDGKPDENNDILLHATGQLLAFPMKIDGRITSNPSIKAHGAVNADIRASFGDARMTGKLRTGELKTLADLDSNFHLVIPDVKKTLEKAGIQIPLGGELTADLAARSAEKGLDVSAKTTWKASTQRPRQSSTGATLEKIRIQSSRR